MSILGNLWNKVSDAVSNAYSAVMETVGTSKGVKNAATAVGNIPMVQNKPEETYIRRDIGHGHTKIFNQAGVLVKVEIDDMKADGTQFLWDAGVEIVHVNTPEPKEKSLGEKFNDAVQAANEWGNRHSHGMVRGLGQGLATTGGVVGGVALAAGSTIGGATVLGGVAVGATSCSPLIEEDVTQEITNTTMTQTITVKEPFTEDGKLSDEALNKLQTELLNSVIGKRNSSFPETKDKILYEYEDNGDGTGSIVILNTQPGGQDMKLGFEIEYKLGQPQVDADGTYTNTLTMTAKPTSAINNSEVLNYIDIIGGEHKTSTGVNYAYAESSESVVTTYETTGFTHKIGETAEVKPESPLGKMQKMLHDLAVLPQDPESKVAANASTGGGAYGQGNGVAFKVDGGDLHEITTDNPFVEFALNDMLGNTINVHGKLSVEGNIIKITNAADGKVLTLTHKDDLVMNGSECKGVSVEYDGNEVFRMSTDKFNGQTQTVLSATGYDEYGDYGTVTYTNFPANTPNLFDGKTATTESDKYFNEKKTNLEDAYKTGIAGLSATQDIKIPGTKNPGQSVTIQVTTHTEANGKVIITKK